MVPTPIFALMKKFFIGCLLLGNILCLSAQNVVSPREFLGYEIGEHYTPCSRVVDYFNQVSQAVPSKVKVQKYGETNERRDLIVAFISSAENIQNLENIRKNNLRLAGLLNDGVHGDVNAPVIVWL